ncbi:hypothetical protein D3C81_1172950 [compost metagenome]
MESGGSRGAAVAAAVLLYFDHRRPADLSQAGCAGAPSVPCSPAQLGLADLAYRSCRLVGGSGGFRRLRIPGNESDDGGDPLPLGGYDRADAFPHTLFMPSLFRGYTRVNSVRVEFVPGICGQRLRGRRRAYRPRAGHPGAALSCWAAASS